MIAKCKAIAHGSNALECVFQEGKLGWVLALHNLCGETPKEIHEEMKLISDYNLFHYNLTQAESQIERIASKTRVIQLVIVILRPQMTSALCLCRFK